MGSLAIGALSLTMLKQWTRAGWTLAIGGASGIVAAGLILLLTTKVTPPKAYNPFPGLASVPVSTGFRQEALTVSWHGTDLVGTAELWPKAGKISAVWLNPRLKVITLRSGTHALAWSRTRGWIRFAGQARAIQLTYRGNPQTTVRSMEGNQPLFVGSFVSASGALLQAGAWYPLSTTEAHHPLHPPVEHFGLRVLAPQGLTTVSNVGVIRPNHTVWRASTGLSLVTGNLTASRLGALTIWSGPSTKSAWLNASKVSDPDGGRHAVHRLDHSYWPDTISQLKRLARLTGDLHRAPLVALLWVQTPTFAPIAGNPNPLAAAKQPPGMAGSGLLGLFSGMVNQPNYFSEFISPLAVQAVWASISPRWLQMNLGGLAAPRYQLPALTVMGTLQTWYRISGIVMDTPALSPPPGSLAAHLATLSGKARTSFWHEFVQVLATHWPSERTLGQWWTRQLSVLTPSGQALIVSQRGDRGQSHGTGGRPTHALVLLTACDAEIVGFFTAIAGITRVQDPA